MSIFMLDAGQLEYAVNSTIRTSWTVSDPETQSADTLLGTLQTGNVHGLIVAVCVLAMVAFERKQGWLGGPLLGFAIQSKLFPGVLLVYLLLRRQWRAVIWTLAAIVALSLATLLLFGVEPFASFVHFQSKLRGSPGARPLASRQEPCVRSKPTCP